MSNTECGRDDWMHAWRKKADGRNTNILWSGAYWEFQTPDQVLHAGADGNFDSDTPCALTSCTKLYAGLAVMRTMHLKPKDWSPDKYMYEFPGWEEWRDIPVLDNDETSSFAHRVFGSQKCWTGKVANVTVHHLLTHTSGWPFGLRGTRQRIRETPLYFEPGTAFGYSIGHRLLGWMLLDYWKTQPEGEDFQCLDDVFRFLVYEPLGLSTATSFIHGQFETPHSVMGEFFDMRFFEKNDIHQENCPADLAMQSTGSDLMKLAMLALRRGQLPDGSWFIPEEQWNDWAGRNRLPGGKLSSALAHWRMAKFQVSFIWRNAVTRTANAGSYGWNYFGATYHKYEGEGDAGECIAVGWKGFSSCGLRADYEQNVAFVVMQECVPDPICRNFGECVHQGKVGDYSLIHVAERLAQVESKSKAEDVADSCQCGNHQVFHNVMMRTEKPKKRVVAVQSMIRTCFKMTLPGAVRIMDFHKRERILKDGATLRLVRRSTTLRLVPRSSTRVSSRHVR